jgi:RNA polymerase sigma-70 factor (ECF subfamily)
LDTDQEAWQTFVDLYTPLVYRFCRGRGLQDADASDVTQQVLSIVHRTIGKFEYDRERGRFRSWLGAVTAHEITRYQRKQQQPGKGAGDGWGSDLADLESAAVDPAWAEEFNGYIYQLALSRIQAEFDPLVWQAFELTLVKDVKPRAAAQQLGKTPAWVCKARYKVLDRLRKELDFLTSDAALFHKPR